MKIEQKFEIFNEKVDKTDEKAKKILFIPYAQPFTTPYFSIACFVYSEHDG